MFSINLLKDLLGMLCVLYITMEHNPLNYLAFLSVFVETIVLTSICPTITLNNWAS